MTTIIDQLVAKHTRRSQTWVDKLDEPARKQLEAIKKKFQSGGYGKASQSAIARAVIEAAKERGWPVSGFQGVISWLTRREP